MNKLLVIIFYLISFSAVSSELTVIAGKVTTIRTYETNDDSTRVYIAINGNSRVGPNPDVPTISCELWAHTKQVFSTALAEKVSGQKVNVTYAP